MEQKKETKKERFIRIAENRTNKIIDMIRLLGNCANENTYEYNEKDIIKIFTTLERELKVARSKFSIKENEEEKFKL